MCSHIADAFAKWIGRSTHFDAWFPYCWRQDSNVQQLHMKGAGNVFDPSNSLLYLYT